MSGLRDDRAKPAMAQPFLETGKQRLFITGLDMDHAVGRQACLGDRRREKVGEGDNPKHLTSGSRRNSCRKQSCRCAIHGAIAATRDFMQTAQPKSTSRKSPVDVGQTERQDFPRARSTALQVRNALLKLGDNRVCHAIGHENPVLLMASQRPEALICSLFVPFLRTSQLDSGKSLSQAVGTVWQATAQHWPIVVDSESDRGGTV